MPSPSPKKQVKLVLDLDDTAWLATQTLEGFNNSSIDTSTHEFSWRYEIVQHDPCTNKTEIYYIAIINPQELKALLLTAYKKYGGIMVLTAGTWDSDVLEIFWKEMELPRALIDAIEFHSASTDWMHFQETGQSQEEAILSTMYAPKKERLEKINAHNKAQKSETLPYHYVLLDNSLEHVNSLKDTPNARGVLATTNMAFKDFYQNTIDAMLSAAYQIKKWMRNQPALTEDETLQSASKKRRISPSPKSPGNSSLFATVFEENVSNQLNVPSAITLS